MPIFHFCFLTLFLLSDLFSFSNITTFPTNKEVSQPSRVFDPAVLFEQNQKLAEKKANRYFLRVENGSNELVSGIGTFSGESFSFKEEYRNSQMKVLLAEVRSLTFKRWSGKAMPQGGTSFYPVRYDLELKTGKLIHIFENINLFNSIRFEPEKANQKKAFAFYSYYVDYYRDGKWASSGEKGKSYAEEHPNPLVIRRIMFVE